MQDINYKFSLSEEDKVGKALSQEILLKKHGECLTSEELASLVEGNVKGEKKDRMYHHLSGCDDCYNTFILTSELHKDKAKVLYLKPLSIAASVLVIIFSVYIYFNINDKLPKTPADMLETPVTYKKEKEIPKSKAVGVPKKGEGQISSKLGFEDKSKKRRAKKGEPSDPKMISKDPGKEGEKNVMHAPGPRKGEPAANEDIARKRKVFKEMEQKVYKQEKIQPQVVAQDKIQQVEESEVDLEKKKVTRDETVPPREEKMVTEQVSKVDASIQTQTVKRSDLDQPKMNRKLAKTQLSSSERQQDQLQNRLNVAQQQALNFSGFIPQRDITNMFRESMRLAKMSQREMDSLWENDLKDGYIKKSESITNQVKPLMNVTNIDKAYYLTPDINWFLSKSEPGSIEHQFFKLARFGWCENRSTCYSNTFKPVIVTGKPAKSKSYVRQTAKPSLSGRIEKTKAKTLLTQWQKLYPQLDGVFQQIAQQTIDHLEAIK